MVTKDRKPRDPSQHANGFTRQLITWTVETALGQDHQQAASSGGGDSGLTSHEASEALFAVRGLDRPPARGMGLRRPALAIERQIIIGHGLPCTDKRGTRTTMRVPNHAPGENRTRDLRFERPPLFGSP